MGKLDNKVAIVTGASRGIGFAVAKKLEGEGTRLVLTARVRLDALDSFKDALKIKLDLGVKKDINNLIGEALSAFGRIDILVNNAALFKQTDFNDINEEELDNFINIDFKGPFLLLQGVFAQMKKQKSGKIINIVSGAAKMGSSKAAHYAALKAGLLNLTKSLAKLGGPYNINVNAVAPGFIETEMIAGMLKGKRQEIEKLIPFGKIGKPEDLAGVVRFLASDESNYITGQTICVDGGHCTI